MIVVRPERTKKTLHKFAMNSGNEIAKDMKASRLIFTLLLASSVAVVQLAAQQTKADQKPIEEVKAKAEAGDAKSQVELGRRYDKGEGVMKDPAEAAKWYLKATEQNYAMAQYNLGLCYEQWQRSGGESGGGGEMVSQSRRAESRRLNKLGICYERARRGDGGLGRGLQVAVAGSQARP